MQAQKVIELLTKQLALHKSLLAIAERKTDVLKQGTMEMLHKIIQDEQTHVAAINQLEQVRKKETMMLLSGQLVRSSEPTLSDLLPIVSGQERELLQGLQKNLGDCIRELKRRNELNQELIMQSLQFVNANLELLSPKQNINEYNYHKAEPQTTAGRSLFNSKA